MRIALFVILLFAALSAVGALLPSKFSVESVTEINAEPEDVYPYLVDMKEFQVWSPWAGPALTQDYIVGGSESGIGQESAWRCTDKNCIAGTQRIIAAEEPEFVQTDLTLLGEPMTVVYALTGSEQGDSVTVLMKVDRSLGGFPFVQRFLKSSKAKSMTRRFDDALARLKAQVEADIEG